MDSDNTANSKLILEKTAIGMLKAKLDYKLIKLVTGFSQETLDKLKNKL